jgi:hypothetical protein
MGELSADAQGRINATREANTAKFDLKVVDAAGVAEQAAAVGGGSLADTLKLLFIDLSQ